MLFDANYLDLIKRDSIAGRLARILQKRKAFDILPDSIYESCILESSPNRLRLLECFLTTESSARNVVSFLPKEHYWRLNHHLSSSFRRRTIHWRIKCDLLFLLDGMSERGCGLTGDIIRMSAEQVLVHAASERRIRNPSRTVNHLERILAEMGLGLNMLAPGWVRQPAPSIEMLIAQRDERIARRFSRNVRPTHLRLVNNSD
jgi:hypothetical protein